jgi:hypothetical protein
MDLLHIKKKKNFGWQCWDIVCEFVTHKWESSGVYHRNVCVAIITVSWDENVVCGCVTFERVRILSTSIVERIFLNWICWLYTYDKKIAHDGTDDDDMIWYQKSGVQASDRVRVLFYFDS